MTDSSDEELMRRYQIHLEADVFERLLERYWARGFAVAVRLLHDRHAAEDALQEVALRLLRSAALYDCGQPFASWFYVILRNTCLDMRRRQQPALRSLDRVPDYRTATPAEPSVNEDTDAGDLLARLPAADRDVLLLRVVHSLPFAEIALALGCSEESARKRAQRALRRLRQKMAPAHLLEV